MPMTKSDNPTNVAKVRKIRELFVAFAECQLTGEYRIEWAVKDGVIQDISTEKVTGGVGVSLRISLDSQQETINKHHEDSLKPGWHGTKGLGWIIHPGGTCDIVVIDKQSFR